VASFEQEFAAYLGVRHAIGVGSGTDALHLALRACGIGPGLPVFTVAHTAVATVAAVELCGATPVLVDINPADFTMDPNRLEDAVKTGTARNPSPLQDTPFRGAIIPVHLYGQPADTTAILAIARRYDLALVEDCAQSHGATDNGQMTGAIGDIAAFSFYPTKNLGALGDGGAVVTSDANLAERVRLLREYGWRERYVSDIPGLNSRLDELQAAILRVKLRHLDADNALRRRLAAEYDHLLAKSGLALPQVRPGAMPVYHQYVVRTAGRDALQTHLRSRAIGALIHYPVPVHLQPAYAGRLPGADALPETETAARQVLSLPMFPELTGEQVRITAAAVAGWAAEAL
jgi:dTDP-4-amino-4,6-dideoxygalactose transaminase